MSIFNFKIYGKIYGQGRDGPGSLAFFFVVLEVLNRHYDHSFTYHQTKFIAQNKKDLEGFIFGSSHNWRGIHPEFLEMNTASLARPGSRPNIDYLLFEYALERTTPKFLILDLSQGYLSGKRSINWIKGQKMPFYFSNIRGEGITIKDLFFVQLPLKHYLDFGKKDKLYDQWGFENRIPMKRDIFKQLDYKDSLIISNLVNQGTIKKHNAKSKDDTYGKNIELYKKIIGKCSNRGVKVIFISAPKYYFYTMNLDKQYVVDRQEFLNQVVDNRNVFFLNYETFLEREPALFFNINHLNPKGAQILTQKLNEDLNMILKNR